jgi:hypothetical protein
MASTSTHQPSPTLSLALNLPAEPNLPLTMRMRWPIKEIGRLIFFQLCNIIILHNWRMSNA